MTARQHSCLPHLAVIFGIAAFSAMDATMKRASLDAGVYSALLLRNAFATGLIAPVWLARGGGWPDRTALKVHVVRSAVVAGMAVLFFWGLTRMAIAEAIALSFIAPLIALYLATILLKETVRPAAILASLVGLAGVGVIAFGQLRSGNVTPTDPLAIAAVLLSAVFYAWNLILQRQQALRSSPVEVALFQNLFVGLIVAVAAPWFLHWPDGAALMTIGLAAVLALVALSALSWGYARAEAQALVPIEYTAFLWAALFGWLAFDEPLTGATLAGAALVVLGSWIAMRKSGSALPTP